MMSPQEVLQGQRNIAPRTGFTPKVEGVRTGRDDRRRATHNEGNDFYEPWETDTKWFLIGAKNRMGQIISVEWTLGSFVPS